MRGRRFAIGVGLALALAACGGGGGGGDGGANSGWGKPDCARPGGELVASFSLDGGRNLARPSAAVPKGDVGDLVRVSALALDPARPGRMRAIRLVGTQQPDGTLAVSGELMASEDHGCTWGVAAATFGSRLEVLADGALLAWRPESGLVERHRTGVPAEYLVLPTAALALAARAEDAAGFAMVGVDGGVYMSFDGGASWQVTGALPMYAQFGRTVIDFDRVDPAHIAALGAYPDGVLLAVTRDGGATWTSVRAGERGAEARAVRAVPGTNEVIALVRGAAVYSGPGIPELPDYYENRVMRALGDASSIATAVVRKDIASMRSLGFSPAGSGAASFLASVRYGHAALFTLDGATLRERALDDGRDDFPDFGTGCLVRHPSDPDTVWIAVGSYWGDWRLGGMTRDNCW